ncbi:MAG: hypothetical protein ACRDBG_20930 [Waterburya sp.]
MNSEQQKELEKIEKLISDRFDKIDRRLETQINELKIEIIKSESKLSQEIVKIKVDTTWIKWLFGGLLSFILVLLSVIITVLFKLVG